MTGTTKRATLPATDVVVVGAGAAGAIAGLRLAEAGLRVVALEAGPGLGRSHFEFDELANDVRNQFGAKSNAEIPTWRPGSSVEATQRGRDRYAVPIVNAVGGTTLHYGGQHFRFLPWHFKLRSATLARYGADALPADCTATDWPISYDELEAHYAEVERIIGVSGQAGNLGGRADARGNILEAPRRDAFPLSPLRRSGWNDLMADAGRRHGWHPFPGPAAIDSAKCTYCGFCNFHGCRVGAKGSTFENAIPRAQAAGMTLVTQAQVTEITVGADGRASGVVYVKDGETFAQPASAVFLSSHMWENTRLLLLSRSAAFPNGLSNNHGQVGRNAMTQVYCLVDGFFPGMDLARFNGTVGQATCFDELNADNFDHTGLGFVGGACISAIQEQHPMDSLLSTPPSVPRWGKKWKDWLAQNARSVGRMHATLETLPYSDSLLDLDPAVCDARGQPVLRATYRLHEQERRRWDYFLAQMGGLLREAGAVETWSAMPLKPAMPFPSAYGATRMGGSPENSVVDAWCLSHEVPNLAIGGGGCFPTSGGYNPTATLQALALRTADRLVEVLGR